jgi:hypothetical protein
MHLHTCLCLSIHVCVGGMGRVSGERKATIEQVRTLGRPRSKETKAEARKTFTAETPKNKFF